VYGSAAGTSQSFWSKPGPMLPDLVKQLSPDATKPLLLYSAIKTLSQKYIEA